MTTERVLFFHDSAMSMEAGIPAKPEHDNPSTAGGSSVAHPLDRNATTRRPYFADASGDPSTSGGLMSMPRQSTVRASLPASASAKPDGSPSSTTEGASSGPTLSADQVGEFPLDGRFVYWPETTSAGVMIWRRDLQSNSIPEVVAGPYGVGDSAMSFDTTTTHFRVFQSKRATIDVGASSTVGGRRTGYDINTGDASPGRRAAALVAHRVGRLRSINEANRRFWGTR
jgi:hypothetical protein